MKKFFKKNLLVLILFSLGIVFLLFSYIINYAIFVSSVIFGIVFIILGFKLRKKYKTQEDYSYEEDYLDGRNYDFDEDVYYIGDLNKPRKKEIKKNFISKLAFSAPSIAMFFLGVGFIAISIAGLIKLFL